MKKYERLNMKPEILPNAKQCPFCGAPAEVQYWHGGKASKRLIGCSNEMCAVAPSVTGETKAEALACWNARETQS